MSDYNEILKYIMHTPENTNPAIIKSMLDNYEKPAAGVSLPEIILTQPTDSDLVLGNGEFGVILYDTTAGIIANDEDFVKIYGVPIYINDLYKLDINLESRGDDYNVIVNENSISFDEDAGAYAYSYSSATYPEGFTIVITNKE